MDLVSYLNPAQLHSNPAFTQAVRIPAGHDLIVIGGQNAVDSSGRHVDLDTRHRLIKMPCGGCVR